MRLNLKGSKVQGSEYIDSSMWTVVSGVATEVPVGIFTPFENVNGWRAIRVDESACQYMLCWEARGEGRGGRDNGLENVCGWIL